MQENGASTTLVGTAPLLFSLADIPVYLITDRLLVWFHYSSSLIFACLIATFRFGWYALLPDPQWILYGFFLQSISNTFILIASVKVILYLVDDKYLNTAYSMLAMLSKAASHYLCRLAVDIYWNGFLVSRAMSLPIIFMPGLRFSACCFVSVFPENEKRQDHIKNDTCLLFIVGE